MYGQFSQQNSLRSKENSVVTNANVLIFEKNCFVGHMPSQTIVMPSFYWPTQAYLECKKNV